MNLKKIILVLISITIILLGTTYGVKKYIFAYKYEEYVNKYSEMYDLDPLLVLSVIKTESKFNETAQSKKGAKGLMQIMDDTGAWAAEEVGIKGFTPNMLYSPEINIQLGCWYLDNLLDQFEDLSLALTAYNGGSGNVTKWLQDPKYSKTGEQLEHIPFPETKKYVDKVTTNFSVYKYLYR